MTNSSDFEQYFARKTDKISQEAIRLLDLDLKNGMADVFLLPDNAYATSKVGQTYNWLVDSWDNPQPDNIALEGLNDWFSDKEIWRESDKKMPRGYRLTPSLSDVVVQKTLYDLKPVAELAHNERVKVHDQKHLNEAVKFAARLPEESQSSLGWGFTSLKNLIENAKEGYMLHIVPDFVKNSFYFYVLKDEEKKVFDGGVIMHGTTQETFAVELCPRKGIYWSVHT